MVEANLSGVQYAGFWRRFAATIIDIIFFSALSSLILYMLYGAEYFDWLKESKGLFATYGGWDAFINNGLPVIITLFCWVKLMGTPGKLLLGCQVVDAVSLKPITLGQAVVRYLGYIVSFLALGLGFFWIAWDARKQGFHDKLAKTVVIHEDESRMVYKELEHPG